MNNHSTVSVIIPVYNDQTGIDRCIAALADQSYPRERCEIIIVDNGSETPIHPPPTGNPAPRVIRCNEPGAYAARNAGMALAKGNILAFTDADCLPSKHWISSGVDELERHGLEAIVGGQVELMRSSQPTAVERYQCLVGFMQRENIEERGFSATANLFVGRLQAMQIGPFNERLLSGGDREWCWRAQRKGFSIKYSSQAVVATSPRTTLRGAIRQARRVAGGRRALSSMPQAHIQSAMINPHRSNFTAATWIIRLPGLSAGEKIRMIGVGLILKLATVLERVRLQGGSKAERR